MPLSSAQAEARPSLALSTLDLVSPSQVQCLESLLAPMTSAGKKKKSIHLHVLQSPGRSEVTQLQVPRPEGLHSSDILFANGRQLLQGRGETPQELGRGSESSKT